MKRRRECTLEAAWAAARARIAWCIVGTAVYHVAPLSSSQSRKRGARNPGVQQTYAPADSDASRAYTSPWMWNSGMTLRQTSSGVSASVSLMLVADAQRFRCRSGTIFGRAVRLGIVLIARGDAWTADQDLSGASVREKRTVIVHHRDVRA